MCWLFDNHTHRYLKMFKNCIKIINDIHFQFIKAIIDILCLQLKFKMNLSISYKKFRCTILLLKFVLSPNFRHKSIQKSYISIIYSARISCKDEFTETVNIISTVFIITRSFIYNCIQKKNNSLIIEQFIDEWTVGLKSIEIVLLKLKIQTYYPWKF